MQNKMIGAGKNAAILVTNVAIVILCIVFVSCAGLAVSGLRDAFSVTYSENNMYYRLYDENFYQMVEGYYTNLQEGHEPGEEMKEYYGVAKFYEAASMYKAFSETGDMERAAREQEKMKFARQEMGDWTIVEPQILEQLDIQ